MIWLPFGKLDIRPCILYMRILAPPHLYQALDTRTDCMERPRPQILKPITKTFLGTSAYGFFISFKSQSI